MAVMMMDLIQVVLANCRDLVTSTCKLRPGRVEGLPEAPGTEQPVWEGG